jgi:rubrerythrin
VTAAKVRSAFGGESFEIVEMYLAHMAVAGMREEKGTERSMHCAISAEKIHATMYQEAERAADEGKDAELGPVQAGAVCGYMAEGEAPDKCPILGAAKRMFRTFAQAGGQCGETQDCQDRRREVHGLRRVHPGLP